MEKAKVYFTDFRVPVGRNIMQKLGVQSVAALVICAVSMGYVDESDIRTPHK